MEWREVLRRKEKARAGPVTVQQQWSEEMKKTEDLWERKGEKIRETD